MSVRMPAPSSGPVSDALALIKLCLDPEARKHELNELLKGRHEYDEARLAAEKKVKELTDLSPRLHALEARERDADERLAKAMTAEQRVTAAQEKHKATIKADAQEASERARHLDQRSADLTAAEHKVAQRERSADAIEERLQKMNAALNEKERRLGQWHDRLAAAIKE